MKMLYRHCYHGEHIITQNRSKSRLEVTGGQTKYYTSYELIDTCISTIDQTTKKKEFILSILIPN